MKLHGILNMHYSQGTSEEVLVTLSVTHKFGKKSRPGARGLVPQMYMYREL